MSYPKKSTRWTGSELETKLSVNDADSLAIGLLTDVDRTILIQEGDPNQRSENETHIRRLTQLAEHHRIPIIAVTARDISMMERDHRAGLLPLFDAVLCALGGELFVLRGGKYEPDLEYRNFIEEARGFQRELVQRACEDFFRRAQNLELANPNVVKLTFQPRDTPENNAYHMAVEQGIEPPQVPHIKGQPPQPYKISFNFYGEAAISRQLECLLKQTLIEHELEAVEVLMSIDSISEDGVIRNNIDVLPIQKGDAANIVADELNEFFGRRMWAFAGDSFNDASAILTAGDIGIVVGGSRPDLTSYLSSFQTIHAGDIFTVLAPAEATRNKDRLLYWNRRSTAIGPGSIIEAFEFWVTFNRSFHTSS